MTGVQTCALPICFPVTIDGYGNAVDDNGEIKFTKEQIDAMSDEGANELDGDYIEAISKASGIVIKDEKGEPVKFEPTIEGFAKREAAVKALGEREGFAKGFNEFLANNPDIAALVEYKSKFGTIEGYSANVDYSKVEIKDDDNLLADLIYKAEIQKGTSPELVEDAFMLFDTQVSTKSLLAGLPPIS